jgi:hypothetical protein
VDEAPQPVMAAPPVTLPEAEPVASKALTTFKLSSSATSPKTTCLPSSQAVGTVVMKNWEPLLCITSVGVQHLMSLVDLRVGAGVSHGEEAGLGVLDLEVLIGELITVN